MRGRRRGARGLTLVESLVVLALLVVLAGLSMANWGRAKGAASAQSLADVLAGELQLARQRAISSQIPVAVCFPSAGGSIGFCQSFYVLEGEVQPRLTRVSRLEGDFPQAAVFCGMWSLDTSKLQDPAATNTITPPPIAARAESFDPVAWGPPYPSDPCYVFLPSGVVRSNDQVLFDGAYHLAVVQGLRCQSAALGGSSFYRLTETGPAFTITLTPGGDVRVTAGILAASSSLIMAQNPGFPGPSAPAPNLTGATNQPPVISSLEVQPVPVAVTLPPGADATVDLQGYLTMQLKATDPDGDPLFCTWVASEGPVSSSFETRMEWDGTAWTSVWEWSPPQDATQGKVYDVSCQVRDLRGGVATDVLGAAGKVEVIGGGKITFTSDRDGNNRDIYLMNPDGTEVTNLTHTPWNESYPVGSPDGKRIVFWSDQTGKAEIYVMNIDGTNAVQLTTTSTDAITPDWSPDGTHITYCRTGVGGGTQTWIMHSDGTDQKKLVDNPGDGWTDTSWFPDGSAMVTTRMQGAVAPEEDVEILNVDGTVGANLTNLGDEDLWAHISPDATMLTFYRKLNNGSNAEIMVGDFNGTSLTNLRNVSNNNGWDDRPSWAPDSKNVVFMSDRDGNREIYRVDPNGKGLVRLTNDPAKDEYPFWCP